jgi:hypothetical protein
MEHKLDHVMARKEAITSENEALKRDVDLCGRYIDDKEHMERELTKENRSL